MSRLYLTTGLSTRSSGSKPGDTSVRTAASTVAVMAAARASCSARDSSTLLTSSPSPSIRDAGVLGTTVRFAIGRRRSDVPQIRNRKRNNFGRDPA
eukprot:scaffold27336_cov63-Phaeocystis_antarctica.AAC.5